MGNDATTRREFIRFLYRGTIGSKVDEFFNALRQMSRRLSRTRDPSHLEMYVRKPDRERIPRADY